MPNPDGPRLALPREQLVINPSPQDVGRGPADLDEASRRRFRESLEDQDKGPGGHPGDDDGDGGGPELPGH